MENAAAERVSNTAVMSAFAGAAAATTGAGSTAGVSSGPRNDDRDPPVKHLGAAGQATRQAMANVPNGNASDASSSTSTNNSDSQREDFVRTVLGSKKRIVRFLVAVEQYRKYGVAATNNRQSARQQRQLARRIYDLFLSGTLSEAVLAHPDSTETWKLIDDIREKLESKDEPISPNLFHHLWVLAIRSTTAPSPEEMKSSMSENEWYLHHFR